jgi:rubrerythrin
MKIVEKDGAFVIVDFDEAQAYTIACKVEKDGLAFYQRLYDAVKDKAAGEKLRFLMEEERKHLAFFEDNLARVSQDKENGFEEDGLVETMDFSVFQPYAGALRETASAVGDARKALRLGTLIEDHSIRFYQACKEKVSSVAAQEAIAAIIEEEKKHKALLETMRQQLS